MSKVNLNKKSVKQQGGQMIPQEPGMQNTPQVDPMVQKVSEMISMSVQEGRDIIDIVTQLSKQEVDQQVISQALMMGGMEEAQIFSVFEQVQENIQPPGPSSPEAVNRNPQLLARNEEMESTPDNFLEGVETDIMGKSGIEIKKENRGKFTKWAKARGMGVQEAARKVMANKDKYPPSVVKMANFARNAAKFNKEDGGETFPDLTGDGVVTQADILKGRGVFQSGGATETIDDYYQDKDGNIDIQQLDEVVLKPEKSFLQKVSDAAFVNEDDNNFVKYLKNSLNPLYTVDNALQILGMAPALVRESIEGISGIPGVGDEGGLGDGKFNFKDIVPDLYGTTILDEDKAQTPVSQTLGVDNFWGRLGVDMVTDPTTYIGAGVAKNLIQKFGKNVLPKLAKFSGAKYADDILQQNNGYKTLTNQLLKDADVGPILDKKLAREINSVDPDLAQNAANADMLNYKRAIEERNLELKKYKKDFDGYEVESVQELLNDPRIPTDVKDELLNLSYMREPLLRERIRDMLDGLEIPKDNFEEGGDTSQKGFFKDVDVSTRANINPFIFGQDQTTTGGGFDINSWDQRAAAALPFSGSSLAMDAFLTGTGVLSNMFSSKIDSDTGLKAGYLRDLGKKTEQDANRLPSYFDYKIEVDDSQENINALSAYYKKFLEEQQTIQKDNQLSADQRIAAAQNKLLEQIDLADALSTIPGAPDVIETPYVVGKDGNVLFQNSNQGAPLAENKYGGVPKAQTGEEILSFKEWVQVDPVRRSGASAPDDYQVYLQESSNPVVQDVETSADLLDKVNMPELKPDNVVGGFLDFAKDSNAMDLYTGASTDLYNLSRVGNKFFDMQNFYDQQENRANNLMADNLFPVITSDVGDKGNYKVMGDVGQLRSTKDRIATYDEFFEQPIMRFPSSTAAEGGEPDNEGFRALPDFVQDKIMKRQEGGEKGEAAYLANRDRVIKREMAKAQDGDEIKNFFTMDNEYVPEYIKLFKKHIKNEDDVVRLLQEMNLSKNDTLLTGINRNKTAAKKIANNNLTRFIAEDLDPFGYYGGQSVNVNYENKGPYYTSEPDPEDGVSYDFMEKMFTTDDGKFLDVIKSKMPNKQTGGETVELSQDMITELIAAGADIEIL